MLAEQNNSNQHDSRTSDAADESWSPEQETALLLDLCEAQIDAALRDSDKSVDVLVRAFTNLVQASQAMSALARNMPAQASDGGAELCRQADELSAQVNDAIVAFQFYDKLSQRLGHVRHSLTTLALFICNRTQTQQREHWLKLLTSLRRLYRTADERAVFDLVAEGATADEVRATVQDAHQHSAESSVELF